ncbi:cytochrome P450 [Novosphingobium sp.]|uniref:cytochrome P450 n=1 Tax=Novosphingobium sp. TaxID=1874826 RepID=UPI0038B8B1D9
MTTADAVAKAVTALAADGPPPLQRAPELEMKSAPSVRVFVAAHHAAVNAILCDEERFSLRHYDELLAQVAGPTRYLVGENDDARKLRLRLLHAAQGHVDAVRRPAAVPNDPLPPNLALGYRDFIATIARDEASRILKVLAVRGQTGSPVNFAREYAFLLAYRMARRVVGVSGPDKAPLLVWLMIAYRNWTQAGPKVSLKGEAGTATTMLTLLHPLFGHVFGTVVKSTAVMRAITANTARHALASFDLALDKPHLAPPESLLAGLHAVRGQFPEVSDEDYRVQSRSVLFELAGALVLIVGKSLGEIAGFAVSPQGHAAGIDWPGLVDRLAVDDPTRTSHDAVINEMLRLGSSSQLVRTVRNDCTWQGVALNAGDRVLLHIDQASHDPAAFAQPECFAPAPDRPYITSGPLQGPHVCYGRAIAWTIMREAIVATRGQIVPVKGASLSAFLALPDNLAFTAA